MAEIVKDPKIILKWIEAKQRNEQAMLFRLNNLFKGSIPRNKIRKVVLKSFEMMLNKEHIYDAYRAVKEEEGLAVWQKLPRPTTCCPLFRMMRMHKQLLMGDQAMPKLDCNDFAELIRVIGAWFEKGGGFGYSNINKAYRLGVGKPDRGGDILEYLRRITELKKKYGYNYEDRISLNEKQELNELANGNVLKGQKERDDKTWGKPVRQREAPNQHHTIEKHIADFWVKPKFNKQSGMQLFRANRDDLCKKIDLLFGFITGATISGTTTDTAFVLDAVGSIIKPPLHAGYHLFPVATIAASLHHSLLEAGLALTVADVIDTYRAGFYTTLIPKGGLPGELQDAMGILREGEVAEDNRHLLIWYENGKEESPAGCIRWNKPYELRDAKRLAEGKGLLTHMNSMPRVPDKLDILRFLKLMAPRLFAYLPEEFQLR